MSLSLRPLLPRRLTIACIVLAAVNGGELVWAAIATPGDLQTAPQTTATVPGSNLPAFHFPPASQFVEIVARPVFTPSRRPSVQDDVTRDAAPNTAPSLMITGIAATGAHRYFLIHGDTPPHQAPVREGDLIDGWRVLAIATDTVTLGNGGETAVYRVGEPAPAPAPPASPAGFVDPPMMPFAANFRRFGGPGIGGARFPHNPPPLGFR